MIGGFAVPLVIALPKELELAMKKDKNLEMLVRQRLTRFLESEIKNDLFLLMLLDKILKDSELTEEDVERMDYQVKASILEKLGWK